MKAFADLIEALDQTNKITGKVTALENYFRVAHDADRVWAIALLSGRKPKGIVRSALLREWAAEFANIEQWLFEESYHVVGDMAETIALLLPRHTTGIETSLSDFMHSLIELRKADDEMRKQFITSAWMNFGYHENFVFNKLLTGGFRVGVSQQLVVKALAKVLNLEETIITHRLMGNWQPEHTSFANLLLEQQETDQLSRPYPFCLAYALDISFEELGEPVEWQVEWKWDGIRGQIVRRGGDLFVWSRGEELVTAMFPEFESLKQVLPDGTVLDGEILPWRDDRPLPFHIMQKRNGRKNITPKILKEAPIVFLAYDLLEWKGNDMRQQTMQERRGLLEEVMAQFSTEVIHLSPLVSFSSWQELEQLREQSRVRNSEGFMLKRQGSIYETGRKKGAWWKWKVNPFTIDAVLIYAQRGHGRRANLYTDYTFAVWDGDQLIPFAKAYSGLTDIEIREVDAYVKKHTIDKFGPVRSVKGELVFELAFEGINPSPRHRSGVALRFPRINRWRKDKPAQEADTLQTLRNLLEQYGTRE